MSLGEAVAAACAGRRNSDAAVPFELGDGSVLLVEPESVRRLDAATLLVARDRDRTGLYVLWVPGGDGVAARFHGRRLDDADTSERVLCCPMDHANASAARDLLPHTRPTLLGTADSFGLGDRLGLANPAQLRALRGSRFRVVLAQQSIRELDRTARSPDEVLDAASWAVLREGFEDGFGADADHLKLPAHIDSMAAAGFTMFTIDPGDHVVNEADTLAGAELEARAAILPWSALEDSLPALSARYAGRRFMLPGDLVLEADREAVLRALVKYGRALAHCVAMYRHLVARRPAHAVELELSVDETEAVTSPFEHHLFARELERLGVRWVSLAPRFVGTFEKGTDFRGDLDRFREEYLKHLAVAEFHGGYKISIHSGSDKFSVYRVIGAIGRGRVHVKTAGTSYLEALRAVACCETELFREILDFARGCYEAERRSYHVSASLDLVPAAAELGEEELPGLLDQDDARQVLHVTFGRVLTERGRSGSPLFKDRLMACLSANRQIHERLVEAHFRRHLAAFESAGEGAVR